METLRKRIPFKSTENAEDEDDRIMDEEEQEAVMEDIKSANAAVREKHRLALATILALSVGLQVISLFGNPLLNIYPHDGPFYDIPIPILFTLISLGAHINMAIIGSKEDLIPRVGSHQLHSKPLSRQIIYTLTSVAPALALLLQRPVQCLLWWCVTPLVIFTAETIMASSRDSMQSITELETLRYRAFGA